MEQLSERVDWVDITVPVPQGRIAEFYEWFGWWLGGPVAVEESEPPAKLTRWSNTEEDLALARIVWDRLSEPAQGLLSVLMDHPEEKFSGEQLAADLQIPYGKFGIAGVLAWPGRHCKAVGRVLPTKYEEGPVGGSGIYWMDSEIAAMFRKVRESR